MKLSQILSFSALGCLFAVSASAQMIDVDFSDFSDTSDLQINGDAAAQNTSDGDIIRLTPATGSKGGSFFSLTQINAAEFSTKFQFRITGAGGISDGSQTGADGLAFVVQNVANNVGGIGGGIGYANLPNSVAVEFDTFNNGGGDGNSTNHLGVGIDGVVNTSPDVVDVPTRFDDGNIWTAWVDYDGATLEVRANQSGVRSDPNTALLSKSIIIPFYLGQSDAFIGFTAATGSAYGNHDILNWQYSSQFVDGGIDEIPEPGTIGLLSLAGLGAFLLYRKRRKTA